MNRIGKTGESARHPGNGLLLAGAIVLQLACAAAGPADDPAGAPAGEPEAVTVRQSALAFEAPKFPISELAMKISNVNSGQCLDVQGSRRLDATPLQQFPCADGSRNQTFFFTPAGPDSYLIRVGHVAGKNVEVAGGSVNDHAAIQINGALSDAQQFGLVLQSDGSYEIVSKKSGKCFDVPFASNQPQTAIQQFTCAGGANQRWKIETVTAPVAFVAKNSNKCLDVTGASQNDQATVQQLTCAGATNQSWTLATPTTVNGTTFYSLVASHSGRCMDVRGGSLADQAVVQQFHCSTGADNQLWSLTENSDGYVTITNKRSGKCLDVPFGSPEDNVVLQQFTCNGASNQRFYASVFWDRHVQVVQVASASGSGRLTQPDSGLLDHVDRANGVFGSYGSRLRYDRNFDRSNVNSDALFHLGESGTFTCPDKSVGAPDFCAERYAFNWPNKIVVYSRPGSSYSAGSGSYIVVGSVLSPSAFHQCSSSVPDTQALARQVGHYLGVVDTFAFSGDDLISDTRPDPQAAACLAPLSPTGTFNGATVDTNNAVSGYYNITPVITPMQAAQTRATAYTRRVGYFTGMCDGIAQVACTNNQFCEHAPAACTTSKPIGTCTTKPTVCPPDIVPVCGCDGKSYANDCERQAGGVTQWFPGVCFGPSCPPSPPTAGAACSPANITCVYRAPAPNDTCALRLDCTNGAWAQSPMVCPPF